MKYEEDLQHRIESDNSADVNNADVKAYKIVFNALSKDDEAILPTNFADKVVASILKKQEERSFRKDYIWLGIGIFMMVISFIVAIAFTGFKLNFGFLSGLMNFKGLLIFGAAFIGILHYLDKRLINREAKI